MGDWPAGVLLSDARDLDDPSDDEAKVRHLSKEARMHSETVSAVEKLYRVSKLIAPQQGTLEGRDMVRLGLADVRGRHLYEMGETRTLCGLPRADNVSVNSALSKLDDCAACLEALKG